MFSAGRLDPNQSAYRPGCSTETALLKVTNDLYHAMDSGKVTSLITLDISAAFDTIDVSILMERLHRYFGVRGVALEWLRSYLTDRRQYVKINDNASEVSKLQAGVPQGSVLGPILFSLFLAPLAEVIDSFGIMHHQYADDSTLYHSFSSNDQLLDLGKVSDCLSEVHNWFLLNGLLVNPSKSDGVLVGTNQQLKKMDVSSGVVMSGTKIQFSDSVKTLGVTLDKHLSFTKHVNNVCRACTYHIKALRSLRPSLDRSTAETIGRCIVMSRLDYCNSLLSYTTKQNLRKLQTIENNLARLVTGSSYRHPSLPLLASLHWLPVEKRIEFKVATLVFKFHRRLLPDYIASELTLEQHSRVTRSTGSCHLYAPRVDTELAKRSFSFSAPTIWNSLPKDITTLAATHISISMDNFKKKLKTHYYKLAFQ
jgi:hypothetical protein